MLYSNFVPLPRWKVYILDSVDRRLGILIRINGSPFGAYGALNGFTLDDFEEDDFVPEEGLELDAGVTA
jgi:hypothetical protein